MFRPTMIDARGRASSGAAVLAYLIEGEQRLTVRRDKAALDYYHAGGEQELDLDERSTSRFLGAGAAALGLTGEVTLEAMGQLAKGFDPLTGAKLSATAGKEPTWTPKLDKEGNSILDKHGTPRGVWKQGHRVGFDCTFSVADKSASLVFALATPEEQIRILDAHRDAVAQVVDVMQDYLEAGRDRGGVRKIGVKGLVATGHTHMTSRNLDPQLHEHVLLYSVAMANDGQFGGFDANALYDHQQMFGALGRAAFAQNLEKLGYGVEKRPELDDDGRPTGQVYYRVAGVSDDLCDRFSSRRQEALEYQAANGGSVQAAVLATRVNKEEQPLEVIQPIWQEAFERLRANDPRMFKSTDELKGLPSKLVGIDDDTLLRTLHARDAVWTREDLITQLALEHVGQKSVKEIVGEADDFLDRVKTQLVTINPERSPEKRHQGDQPGRRYREDRFAATWWLEETEQKLVDSAKARQDEPNRHVPDSVLNKAIADFERDRGFTLSDEQRAAIRHVTAGNACSVLTGRAGTGKTTVASVFTAAFEADGRECIGVALAWTAAKKLQAETGMYASYSAAKLLNEIQEGHIELTDRHVLVLDEAGMCDTATLRQLQMAVDHAGGQLICVGDAHQLQPIGPGAGFRLLKDAIGDATLTEIRRQRDGEDLETSNLFYAFADRARNTTTRDEETTLGAQILARLEHRKQVEHCDTSLEAIRVLADDYLAHLDTTGEHGKPIEHRNLCVMAGTRSAVRSLNEEIRARLVATGEIAGASHMLATKGENGVRRELPVAVGERLRFGKKSTDLGVDNGSIGVVEAVRTTVKGSLVIAMKLESDIPAEQGRVVRLDTGTYNRLDHAYAQTVHKAQGASVEKSMLFASVGTADVHSMLVAATRHRSSGGFRMYGAESDLELIAERLGMERLRMNALEEGRKQAPGTEPDHVVTTAPSNVAPEPDGEATTRMQRERLWTGYRNLTARMLGRKVELQNANRG
jgi:conjugative relaxase-like TrwC/TraI family protein